MEFQLSYFRSWKMMLWKCYTQYASKFGKLSSGHRTRKGQFSFQFQRKVVPKNVQTTTQLHSSHRLAKWCSKFSKPGFNSTWTVGRGTRDQIANICWIIKKAREFQKNIYFYLIDYAKAFDCVDHNKLWQSLQEIEIPDHLTCLLRNLLQVKKQQLEQNMEQQTGSK